MSEVGRQWEGVGTAKCSYRGSVALVGEVSLLKGYRVGLVAGARWAAAFPKKFPSGAGVLPLVLAPATEHHVGLH